MDKLQITLTLSREAAPDLLAYLGGITGARERAFVFRLLAQRGLRSLGNAGTDGLLPAPAGLLATSSPPATTPLATVGHVRATGDEQGATTPLVPASAGTSIASPEASPSTTDTSDQFAVLDVGALNDAMARFV